MRGLHDGEGGGGGVMAGEREDGEEVGGYEKQRQSICPPEAGMLADDVSIQRLQCRTPRCRELHRQAKSSPKPSKANSSVGRISGVLYE